jgi:hypothetical protein
MSSARSLRPTPAANDDVSWRKFPEFEEVLSSEKPTDLMPKIEKTLRQLKDVLQSGSDSDKSRAKRAMNAYGRSLDLLRSLTEMRDKAAVATSEPKSR